MFTQLSRIPTVIPSLYLMSSSADIISMLLTHGMIIGREKGLTRKNSVNTVLAARMIEGWTNPNCKAKKCSTHTTVNCYWGGKEGQFPLNFGQRNQANVVTASAPMVSP